MWTGKSVVALRQAVLAMAFDALMHATAAFVVSAFFADRIGASMGHIVIVADSLLLFVPSTVSVQPGR